MSKIVRYITGSLVVFLLIMAFWGGRKAHSHFRPCPEIRWDTVYVYDMITTIATMYDDEFEGIDFTDIE